MIQFWDLDRNINKISSKNVFQFKAQLVLVGLFSWLELILVDRSEMDEFDISKLDLYPQSLSLSIF